MRQGIKSAAIGALTGLGIFLGLNVAQSQMNRSFTVPDVRGNASQMWGRALTIEGVMRNVRLHERRIGRDPVKVYSFSLYEPGDPNARSEYAKLYGKHSISVTVLASQFRFEPRDGMVQSVTGTLTPPMTLGSIDPE